MLHITRSGRHYVVRFAYDAPVVDALKAAVPSRCRRWSPERRAWLIDIGAWPSAESVFVGYGLLEGVGFPLQRRRLAAA